MAPWAAAKADSKKPALTLKEIQRLEAEKLNEQKRIEAQIKSEQAAKAWANAAAAEKAVKAEKLQLLYHQLGDLLLMFQSLKL